jgi:hypothetical protein
MYREQTQEKKMKVTTKQPFKYTTWEKVPGITAQKKWDKLVETSGELASEALRRIVMNDPMAFNKSKYVGVMDDYEVSVLLLSKYFTTVRRVGRGQPVDRRVFESFSKALADVNGDSQVLVYGVVTDINSTALSRKYWPFYIAILAAVAERG